ncbi:MAG: hypothetical protein AUK48_12710 [Oscillatoriales cyanobacterium CG2_30_44_21]|nr:MAG: hypothetical protein AUK48_12710 [Oscillatoriales cyanobacterium CG2_30_44_21]
MEIAIALLRHYGFDFGGYTANDLMRAWSIFEPEWVRQAIIEALFQGRYKAISVNQILIFWERKGEIICHHNREFERLICGDFSSAFGEPTPTEVFSNISPAATNLQINYKSDPKNYQPPQIEPLGTTSSLRLSSPKVPIPVSKVYRSAYESMTLLAESSMFVDKLRSICTTRNTVMAEEMPQNEPQAVKAELLQKI